MTDTSTEAVERLAAVFDARADAILRHRQEYGHTDQNKALQDKTQQTAATLRALAAERDAALAARERAEAKAARMRDAGCEVVRAHDSYMATIQDQIAAGNMRDDPLGRAIEALRAALGEACHE